VETPSLAVQAVKFLWEPASRIDPHELYRRLQVEDPIHRTPFDTWIVSRYAEVVGLLHDARFSVEIAQSPQAWGISESQLINRYLVGMMSMRDGDDHKRLHSLVSRYFTVRRSVEFIPIVESIVDEMLNKVMDTGRMDIMLDLAVDLPVNVSCALFSIPKSDWPLILRWTELLTAEIRPETYRSGGESPADESAVRDFAAYLKDLALLRRARPIENDALSALAAADSETLDEGELISFYMMLLMSGRHTATHMIANAVLCLLLHPAQFARLRADRALIRGAVHECLRFESPVRLVARTATEDVRFNGTFIGQRDVVLLLIGAANRDPERFVNHDKFDVARKDNCHLAFGHGMHTCLGQAIGLIQGDIVIDRLLRFAHVELLALERGIPWSDSLPFRSLKSLPIAFRPA
jgi:cytochrome P450